MLLLAKTPAKALSIGQAIETGAAEKVYVARVAGRLGEVDFHAHMRCLSKETFTWGVCSPEEVDARPSRTVFKPIFYSEEGDTTLVLCKPKTGRTHQIRVHLQSLGHAILNDVDYGGRFVGNCYPRYVLFHHLASEGGGTLGKRPKESRAEVVPGLEAFGDFGRVFARKPMEIFLHSKSYTVEGQQFVSSEPYWASPFLHFPEAAPSQQTP